MGTFITIVFCTILFWLFVRPINTFYRARLIEKSRGCPPAEEFVNQFLTAKRPTCFRAALALKTVQKIRDKTFVENHENAKVGVS